MKQMRGRIVLLVVCLLFLVLVLPGLSGIPRAAENAPRLVKPTDSGGSGRAEMWPGAKPTWSRS